MYIKSLSYEDQSTGWKLEKIEFNNPLTLLVGVSGVGKTRILKAIQTLKEVVCAGISKPIEWDIQFVTENGFFYRWCGKFYSRFISTSEYVDSDGYIAYTEIEYEKIFINNELIIDRNVDSIFFNGKETVKLSREESVIYILKEESIIKYIYYAFNNIVINDLENNSGSIKKSRLSEKEINLKLDRYKKLPDIRNSNESLLNKLYFLQKNDTKSFDFIVNNYIDIFSYVDDLKIDLRLPSFLAISVLPNMPNRYSFYIRIKEKKVSNWIEEENLSSGMLKTFLQLAEIYLCADNSVILIDEFENSLGINCIDELTSSILTSERNLQFIITSHHPYIINNIGISHWKIVTRDGSVVTATDAEKFGIGKSKHQAFTQLINLDAYTDGVAS